MQLHPRLFPLSATLHRALLRNLPLDRFPSELVAEREETIQPPSFMLPGDWDRIERFSCTTSSELETRRRDGGQVQQGETRRYRLGRALLTPQGIFTPKQRFVRGRRHVSLTELSAPVIQHQKGFCPLDEASSTFFGHLINDALPASLLRQDDEALILPIPTGWHHATGYLAAAGLEPIRVPLASFQELWLCDDRGMNRHRRARFRSLHERLTQGVTPRGAAGVFLRRGRAGTLRLLVNEDQVAEALSARGFDILSTEDDFDTIRRHCAMTPVFVTVEGSQFIHGHIFGRPGALIVTINPARRYNNIAADMVPAMNQRLATIVAATDGEGFRVEIPRLLELIDRAQDIMAGESQTDK